MKKLAAVLLWTALSACASNSPRANERFRAYVERTVAVGMTMEEATGELVKGGHRCTKQLDSVAKSPTYCQRYKHSILLYSCLQTVLLRPDESGTVVAEIEVLAIACLGGFG